MTNFSFIQMWKTLLCRTYAIFAGFGGLFLHKYLNTYFVAEIVPDASGTSMKITVVFAPTGNIYVRERLETGNYNK